MAYTLPSDKQVQLQISYVDSKGHPASIDGDVVWSSSDPTIADVIIPDPPGPSNSQVWLRPGANIGTVQITATADADLGEGVRNVITLLDVDVVGGEAVAGVIAPVGSPEPIPEGQQNPPPPAPPKC